MPRTAHAQSPTRAYKELKESVRLVHKGMDIADAQAHEEKAHLTPVTPKDEVHRHAIHSNMRKRGSCTFHQPWGKVDEGPGDIYDLSRLSSFARPATQNEGASFGGTTTREQAFYMAARAVAAGSFDRPDGPGHAYQGDHTTRDDRAPSPLEKLRPRSSPRPGAPREEGWTMPGSKAWDALQAAKREEDSRPASRPVSREASPVARRRSSATKKGGLGNKGEDLRWQRRGHAVWPPAAERLAAGAPSVAEEEGHLSGWEVGCTPSQASLMAREAVLEGHRVGPSEGGPPTVNRNVSPNEAHGAAGVAGLSPLFDRVNPSLPGQRGPQLSHSRSLSSLSNLNHASLAHSSLASSLSVASLHVRGSRSGSPVVSRRRASFPSLQLERRPPPKSNSAVVYRAVRLAPFGDNGCSE